jgi:hypothetical protein
VTSFRSDSKERASSPASDLNWEGGHAGGGGGAAAVAVAEHGSRAGGARWRWGLHRLAELWFSAGDGVRSSDDTSAYRGGSGGRRCDGAVRRWWRRLSCRCPAGGGQD